MCALKLLFAITCAFIWVLIYALICDSFRCMCNFICAFICGIGPRPLLWEPDLPFLNCKLFCMTLWKCLDWQVRTTRSEAWRLQEVKGKLQTPGRLVTYCLMQLRDYLAIPNPLRGQLVKHTATLHHCTAHWSLYFTPYSLRQDDSWVSAVPVIPRPVACRPSCCS